MVNVNVLSGQLRDRYQTIVVFKINVRTSPHFVGSVGNLVKFESKSASACSVCIVRVFHLDLSQQNS